MKIDFTALQFESGRLLKMNYYEYTYLTSGVEPSGLILTPKGIRWLLPEPSVTEGFVVVEGLRGIFLRFFLFFFPRFSKPSFSSVGGVGVKTNCQVRVNFLVKFFHHKSQTHRGYSTAETLIDLLFWCIGGFTGGVWGCGTPPEM